MRKAQSLVEYALILILISLVAVTTLNIMGKNMSLSKGDEQVTTEQNINETMREYCRQKGLVYNEQKEDCEKAVSK